MNYPHLQPLERIVQQWKVKYNDEKESLNCFLSAVDILKKHFEFQLNASKTAFKDNSDAGLERANQEFGKLIDWIASTLCTDERYQNQLKTCLWCEVSKCQASFFRNVCKRRMQAIRAPEPNEEDLMATMSIKDGEESDAVEDESQSQDEDEDEGDDDFIDDDEELSEDEEEDD